MNIKTKDVEILDCTIRDGGYLNDWRFDRKLVREVYRSLSKSGVDYVELGFRTSAGKMDPKNYGLWRFVTEDLLRETTSNIDGAKIALMGDYGKIELDDLPKACDSLIGMVRIAAHKNKIFDAIDLSERIKSKGYRVSIQCMGYGNYSETERKELIGAIGKSCVDYVYVADSYGSIYPFEIEGLFEPFLALGNVKVGFHPHNNLQMAFANTLEAIRVGVNIVDTSIYGMGRGAGNLPTEILLAYMSKGGCSRYNVLPVLNCIDRYFLKHQEDTPWGYQLPYMISGVSKCHPFYAKDLVERREYTVDNIWKALEFVEELNPIGYDKDIVNRLIREGVVGGVCKSRLGATEDKKVGTDVQTGDNVSYMNRHKGRDFLVLANGPSLKKCKGEVDEFIKKYDPVILGANFISDLYVPHYHAFNNEKRYVSYIDSVNDGSSLLIGDTIDESLVKEYVRKPYERLRFVDVLENQFDIKNGIVTSNCRTISVLLAAVAVVMGAKRIFIAGMDGYLSKNLVKGGLFYDEVLEPEDHAINVERHHWNEHFLRQIDEYLKDRGAEGLHIITPTTHDNYYKSVENYIDGSL